MQLSGKLLLNFLILLLLKESFNVVFVVAKPFSASDANKRQSQAMLNVSVNITNNERSGLDNADPSEFDEQLIDEEVGAAQDEDLQVLMPMSIHPKNIPAPPTMPPTTEAKRTLKFLVRGSILEK